MIRCTRSEWLKVNSIGMEAIKFEKNLKAWNPVTSETSFYRRAMLENLNSFITKIELIEEEMNFE